MLKSILTVICCIALLPVAARAEEPDALLEEVAAFEAVTAEVENPAFAAWLKQTCDAVRADYADAAERCADAESRLERRACIKGEQQAARGRLTRLKALVNFHAAARKAGCPEAYGVGIATAMEKVLPRALDLPVSAGAGASIAAARREKEAFQVVVTPWQQDLEGMRVRVGTLKNEVGEALPDDAVSVSAMGYVETEQPSRYPVEYVGWWPDPLLDFLDAVDVAQGDAQSFWVRVAVPEDQQAGVYRGEAEVLGKNAPDHTIPVEVRVYDFTLPLAAPLPMAITVTDNHVAQYGDWEELKFAYADFLAEYYINLDDSYRRAPADFEVVRYLEEKGVLRAFNLANIHKSELVPGMDDAAFEEAMTMIEDRIRPAYEQAKEHGVLDKAYIYGFDEVGEDYFPVVQKVAKRLDALFPEVPLLTTTYDDTYGFESGATAVDGWIPLTPRYDPEQAAAARAKGRQVWWYICCGPIHPYANFLIEYSAIEARLLMGAMTAKYRPDGFLYYKITRWPHEDDEPITSGPFVAWNPASYRDYNGDGSLLCPGEDGRPLPTIRLENFRDGLEDFAYVRMLEECIVTVEQGASLSDQDRACLKRAKATLAVPTPLVENLREYTYDPNTLYGWRTRLAEAIEGAPQG